MTSCDKAVALGQRLFFQSYSVHLSHHLCFFYHDMTFSSEISSSLCQSHQQLEKKVQIL